MPTVEHHHGNYLVTRGRSTDLVQTDWDYPATACSLGWSLSRVQATAQCNDCGADAGEHCDCQARWVPAYRTLTRRPGIREARRHGYCAHRCTDGTVVCHDCGLTASMFIEAAAEYLDSLC